MQHFGIIANPVSHSLSPKLYSAIFAKRGIDADFQAILLETSELEAFFIQMRTGTYDGLSVSLPFKEVCIPFLDEIDPVAAAIGAVNTIVREGEKLIGYNTDWLGVNMSVQFFLEHTTKKITSLKWKNVLIVGAGGVAHAAAYAFQQLGAHVYITNRTAEKGRLLAGKFGGEFIESFDENDALFDLVFQATSAGLHCDESALPISFWENHGNGGAIESIYSPKITRFLREADRAGWDIVTGDQLFVGQAMEQVRLLVGVSVPEEEIFQTILG